MLVGDSDVGKTKLADRIANDMYSQEKEASVGFFNNIIPMTIDGRRVKVELWDTVSTQSKLEYSKFYFRKSSGVILMYDATNKQSFQNLSDWLNFIGNWRRHLDEVLSLKLVTTVIVGNKIDDTTQIAVNTVTAKDFAESQKLKCYEVSAKTGEGVQPFFQQLVESTSGSILDIIKNQSALLQYVTELESSLPKKLQEIKPQKKKKGCC